MSSASANTDRPMKRQLDESRRERILSTTRRVFVKDSLVAADNVLGLYNSKKKKKGGRGKLLDRYIEPTEEQNLAPKKYLLNGPHATITVCAD